MFRFAFNTGLRSSELWRVALDGYRLYRQHRACSDCKRSRGNQKHQNKSRHPQSATEQRSAGGSSGTKALHGAKERLHIQRYENSRSLGKRRCDPKKSLGTNPKKAGVRYRNPYQTRHTFATRHISQGVNLFWLAGQMGHKGPEMLFRHYGSYLAESDGKTAISATP
ncbi:tyrosine-type recombinase/integrase [Escherichia coli]